MAISFQSSIAQTDSLRSALRRAQRDFASATIEVSTGTHVDEGVAVGSYEKDLMQFRINLDNINGLQRSNGIIDTRLSTINSSLQSMRELADDVVRSLMAARQGSDRELVVHEANARLMALSELTATSISGAYLFGGTNSSERPVPEDGLIAIARTVVDSSFADRFGLSTTDPAVETIPADDIEAYLDGSLASQFDGISWKETFSSATDERTSSYVLDHEAIPTSSSANEVGIRDLYRSLIGLTGLAGSDLNDAAYSKLLTTVARTAASASQELARVQGQLGIHQERLKNANDALSGQENNIQKQISASTSADMGDAAVRLNAITSQLQASYYLTAQLQKMSLLSYI